TRTLSVGQARQWVHEDLLGLPGLWLLPSAFSGGGILDPGMTHTTRDLLVFVQQQSSLSSGISKVECSCVVEDKWRRGVGDQHIPGSWMLGLTVERQDPCRDLARVKSYAKVPGFHTGPPKPLG